MQGRAQPRSAQICAPRSRTCAPNRTSGARGGNAGQSQPTRLREVINAYQASVAEGVRRWGVHFARYMGDGGRLGKRPVVFPHEPVHDRERDHGLEPFELAEDERPVRPRACERDVEVIAARFCLEPSRSGRPRRAIRSASAAPSALPAARSARPAWHSPPSRLGARAPSRAGSRSGRRCWPVPRSRSRPGSDPHAEDGGGGLGPQAFDPAEDLGEQRPQGRQRASDRSARSIGGALGLR
jgi:hypothetical protein